MSKLHEAVNAVPTWLNWVTIAGSAVLSWVQPIAGVVAIVWGCLQIYLAVERRWMWRNGRERRRQS